jgi:Domain of unknown function (DUF4352)
VTLKRLLIGGLLLTGAVLIIIGIFIGIFNFIGTGNQSVANNEEAAPPAAEAGGVVELGETATFSDRTITVNDLQPGFTFPSNVPHALSNHQYVLVNTTIKNTSTQPIEVSPLSFLSEDSEGVRLSVQPLDKQPDPITVGTIIAPEGELTGNVVVETVQGATGIKLLYLPQAQTIPAVD